MSRVYTNWEKIQRMEKINKDYLDTLDLKKYIEYKRDLHSIMFDIEQVFECDPNMPKELEGYAFNWLDDYDFGLYLEERYGMKLKEHVVSYYYVEEK